MSLRNFEIFRAVMKTGGVSEAARLLGISQPAASKMLREAEAQVGVRLFDRRAGRLTARPEAHALAEAVEQVFLQLERVRLLSEELQEPAATRVKIGAIPTATMTILPLAVARLRTRYPQVRIEISALPTQQIVNQVAMGQLDIGLVYSVKSHPGIQIVELSETEIVCAMHADHPLARQAIISPHDLQGHAFISFHLDEPISLTINEGFRAAGAKCHPAVFVSHSFTSCALAERGVGVALVTPFLLGSGVFRGLVTRPLRPRLPLRPQVLHGRQKTLAPEAQGMIDLLADAVEQSIAARPVGKPDKKAKSARR